MKMLEDLNFPTVTNAYFLNWNKGEVQNLSKTY